jgi:hypothetical protein
MKVRGSRSLEALVLKTNPHPPLSLAKGEATRAPEAIQPTQPRN